MSGLAAKRPRTAPSETPDDAVCVTHGKKRSTRNLHWDETAGGWVCSGDSMCKVTGTTRLTSGQQQEEGFVNNMCYEYFYKGQCNNQTCRYVHAKVKDGVEVKQHRAEAAAPYSYNMYDPAAMGMGAAAMGMPAMPGQLSVEALQLQQQQFVTALMQMGVTAEVIQAAAMASGMQMDYVPAQSMMPPQAYGGYAGAGMGLQSVPPHRAGGPDFVPDMCYEYFYKGECHDANCTYVHAKVKDGVQVKQQRPEAQAQLQARQQPSGGSGDNVLCSKHNKKRSMRNMVHVGDDVWECRPGAPCKGS